MCIDRTGPTSEGRSGIVRRRRLRGTSARDRLPVGRVQRYPPEAAVIDVEFSNADFQTECGDVGQKLAKYLWVKPVSDLKVTLYSEPVQWNALPLEIA